MAGVTGKVLGMKADIFGIESAFSGLQSALGIEKIDEAPIKAAIKNQTQQWRSVKEAEEAMTPGLQAQLDATAGEVERYRSGRSTWIYAGAGLGLLAGFAGVIVLKRYA